MDMVLYVLWNINTPVRFVDQPSIIAFVLQFHVGNLLSIKYSYVKPTVAVKSIHLEFVALYCAFTLFLLGFVLSGVNLGAAVHVSDRFSALMSIFAVITNALVRFKWGMSKVRHTEIGTGFSPKSSQPACLLWSAPPHPHKYPVPRYQHAQRLM
jgi:hypothetical protein